MVPTRRKKNKNKKIGSVVKLVILIGLVLGGLTLTFTGLTLNYGALESEGFYLPKALDKNYGMVQGVDLTNGTSIIYETSAESPTDKEMSSSIAFLQKRLVRMGYEGTVSKHGSNQIKIDIASDKDLKDEINKIGAPGRLYFKDYDGNILMEGTSDNVKNAESRYQQLSEGSSPEYFIILEFTPAGQKAFAEASEACANRDDGNNQIGIYLDDKQVSAPTVSEKMDMESIVIQGSFTNNSARELAETIRSGGLPFTLNKVDSTAIDATLGKDALSTILIASGIGILLVIAFMLIVYRGSGLVASFALISFSTILILLMTYTHMTLSLTSISAMVLSLSLTFGAIVSLLGQAKEQVLLGKSVRTAFEEAFKSTKASILNSNLTILVIALILYYIGAYNIQIFTITLLLGIVVSLFTILMLTPHLIKLLLKAGIDKKHFYVSMKKATKEVKADA